MHVHMCLPACLPAGLGPCLGPACLALPCLDSAGHNRSWGVCSCHAIERESPTTKERAMIYILIVIALLLFVTRMTTGAMIGRY
jgi:hypothetical protein